MNSISYTRLAGIIISIIGIGFLLIVAKSFLVPLVLGALFAFTLYPITSRMEHIGIPRIIANLLGIFGALAAVVAIGILVSFLLSNFLSDIPEMRVHIADNMTSGHEWVEKKFNVPVAAQKIWLEENINADQVFGDNVGSIFATTKSTVATTSLVFIYGFFFLYYRNKFVEFLHKAIPHSKLETFRVVIKKIGTIVPRYLLGILIVVGILSVANSLGFALVGVENAIFFGVLAAILNIIPYLGPVIGFILVFIVTLATQDISTALAVLGVFVIIQFLENNILTPNITAGQVRLNPFIALVGVIAGGLIWGVVGMLISIPILGMIKIMCEHIPSLSPVAFLLDTKGVEKYSLSVENIERRFKIWFKIK